ncbi:MAG: hypothetical protein KTR19_10295 [Hyphomicrobiales bacterium]|nr:hypothetical protein [Hyphomicrobiales bacterium]
MRTTGLATILLALFLSHPVSAGSDGYDASNMWGTAPAGATVDGALESSAMHVQNGVVAGQVNSAEAGLLYSNGSGENYNIYSIGSQSVISNTILGDANDISVSADQQSSNSASVSNNGQINTGSNASNSLY